MAPPVPVKTSHKKDGRHRRPLIFHVSWPPPSDHPGSDTVLPNNYSSMKFTVLCGFKHVHIPTISLSSSQTLGMNGPLTFSLLRNSLWSHLSFFFYFLKKKLNGVQIMSPGGSYVIMSCVFCNTGIEVTTQLCFFLQKG